MSFPLSSLLLENKGIRQTVLKNTIWLACGEIIGRSFTFVLTIYAARILGATEFGVFSFALAFVGIFMFLAHWGIFSIVTREFARDEKNETIFPALLGLKMALSIVAFAIMFLASFLATANPAIRVVVWIIAGSELVNNFFLLIYAFLEARQRMQYEAGAKILQLILVSVFGFLVLWQAPSARNLGFAYFGAMGLALVSLFVVFSLRFQRIRFRWDGAIWRRFLKLSWPIGLANALGMIFVSSDSVILGYLGGITATGWYNAAYRIVGMLMLPSALMLSSFFPVLSRFFDESRAHVQRIYNLYREVTVIIALPMIVGGIVLAPRIIPFLYGESYVPAILAFQILITIAGVNLLYNPYGAMFVVANKQKAILAINAIGAVLNILLNIFLIPRYSLYGAAVATLVTYLLVLCVTIWLSTRYIPLNLLWRTLPRTLTVAGISSTIMFGVIMIPVVALLPVVLTILCGAGAYLLSTVFFIRVGVFGVSLKHWFLSDAR